MRDIIKPAVILFTICVVVSVSLAFTYSVTKDIIKERADQEAEAARKEVLVAAEEFIRIENAGDILNAKPEVGLIKEIYVGKKDNLTQGYVFAMQSKGYGGIINITAGIDTQGKLCAIKIGQNNETPGLGSKAAEPAFKSQLTDLTPKEPLQVIKGKKSKPEEIEAISGATITSKAVVAAAQAALDAANEIVKMGVDKIE